MTTTGGGGMGSAPGAMNMGKENSEKSILTAGQILEARPEVVGDLESVVTVLVEHLRGGDL